MNVVTTEIIYHSSSQGGIIMSKTFYLILLIGAIAFAAAIGCQSTGGGGYQTGSDGHAGHSH